MRKLLLIILFILFFVKTQSNVLAQITFKGDAPKVVIIGERFYVNYVLTTTGEYGKNIHLPETNGLKILFGPTNSGQSSSTTIINGNISTQTSLIFTYVLMAEKQGEWTIPSATIKVGNNKYKSNELKIKALSSSQTSTTTSLNQRQSTYHQQNKITGNDIFVRMHISKTSVYENEGLLVTFKLYSLADFEVENIKFPEFEGFITQEIEIPENRQTSLENYQGHNYYTLILRQVILYPQHTGKISISKGKYDVIVRVYSSKSQRYHNFFDTDDFFDTYSNVKKTLTSPSTIINVKPLPPNPASFSGAVGNYKMTSSISATKLKANEPIIIKITLSGEGNVKMLKNPKIAFPNDFEVYEPKVDVNTHVSTNGVSGTKTIEYYAVPRYAGDFIIPGTRFDYFDLKANTYKTLSTDKYHLRIESDTTIESARVSTTKRDTSKEDIRFIGKNIRHIKTNGFKYEKGRYFFRTFKYLLCYLFLALLSVFIFIIYGKQAKEKNDTTSIRIKKANKIAFKQLKLAHKYLKENKKEAFYDKILKTVWGYLSDKLTIPMSNLTKNNIELELIKYGVNKDLIKEFISILNKAEFAHYVASDQNYEVMSEVYEKTVEIIKRMKKTN